jgi:CRP/FNR family transcriptional regulator, cyclic AMP receptor protein
MTGTESGDGFWERLSETDQAGLSALARPTRYRPGAVVCTEGEPATHVFILMSGWVKVSAVTRDGQEFVLALRGQGDIFGELGEVSGYRTATVRAVGWVQLLLIPHGKFGEFLEAHPGADRTYRRVMTQRWGEANMALLSRSTTTGAQRLAGQLLDLADRHGIKSGGQVRIEMPLSQDELASLVGTSRSTLTRALASWRRRGFIETRYRYIAITDVDGLRRIAHRDPPH